MLINRYLMFKKKFTFFSYFKKFMFSPPINISSFGVMLFHFMSRPLVSIANWEQLYYFESLFIFIRDLFLGPFSVF